MRSNIALMLSERFGVEFKPERTGFGWQYVSEIGDAYWVSSLAPQYPDDDGHYQSQLYLYFNDGRSPEFIMGGKFYSD